MTSLYCSDVKLKVCEVQCRVSVGLLNTEQNEHFKYNVGPQGENPGNLSVLLLNLFKMNLELFNN